MANDKQDAPVCAIRDCEFKAHSFHLVGMLCKYHSDFISPIRVANPKPPALDALLLTAEQRNLATAGHSSPSRQSELVALAQLEAVRETVEKLTKLRDDWFHEYTSARDERVQIEFERNSLNEQLAEAKALLAQAHPLQVTTLERLLKRCMRKLEWYASKIPDMYVDTYVLYYDIAEALANGAVGKDGGK